VTDESVKASAGQSPAAGGLGGLAGVWGGRPRGAAERGIVPPGQLEVVVSTAVEMRALGRRLAALLRAGDLVILSGGLGAGKTTLTQGIGEGLGVRGPVTSPTFVIARVHPPLVAAGGASGPTGPGPALVHADAYRLGSSLELDDLDLDADTATSVTVVEWGEGLAEGLAADRLEIAITPAAVLEGDDTALEGDAPRTVMIAGVGERWHGIQLPPADLADRL
jgi:tRNA threonylcarbamoyladenosine biosynthesis protein TsaE